MTRLLLLGTEGHDDGADHRQPKRHLARRTCHEAFLFENGPLACIPAGAAVLLRPSRRTPTSAVQNLLPPNIVLALNTAKLQHRIAYVCRQMGLDKGAHVGAEGQIL